MALLANVATASLVFDFGTGSNEFSIEFVPIGDVNNAADTTGFGSVDYSYSIARYEISEGMIDKANGAGGLGITHRNLGPDVAASAISWFEAAYFVNWLNTSQGFQAAYDISPGLDGMPSTTDDIIQPWDAADAWLPDGDRFRHKNATFWLPNENEWYKAAYYDPDKDGSGGYWLYPTGSDSQPDGLDTASDTDFEVVYNENGIFSGPDKPNEPKEITNAGVLSPHGIMGLGGNVFEWIEGLADPVASDPECDDPSDECRVIRGGSYIDTFGRLTSAGPHLDPPAKDSFVLGLRVASAAVPEASEMALVLLGFVGILTRRRRG